MEQIQQKTYIETPDGIFSLNSIQTVVKYEGGSGDYYVHYSDGGGYRLAHNESYRALRSALLGGKTNEPKFAYNLAKFTREFVQAVFGDFTCADVMAALPVRAHRKGAWNAVKVELKRMVSSGNLRIVHQGERKRGACTVYTKL